MRGRGTLQGPGLLADDTIGPNFLEPSAAFRIHVNHGYLALPFENRQRRGQEGEHLFLYVLLLVCTFVCGL